MLFGMVSSRDLLERLVGCWWPPTFGDQESHGLNSPGRWISREMIQFDEHNMFQMGGEKTTNQHLTFLQGFLMIFCVWKGTCSAKNWRRCKIMWNSPMTAYCSSQRTFPRFLGWRWIDMSHTHKVALESENFVQTWDGSVFFQGWGGRWFFIVFVARKRVLLHQLNNRI